VDDQVAAFDLAIRSKILPRLNGSQQELQSTLRALESFCKDGGLIRCAEKVERMRSRLGSQGFTSFIE